MKQTNKQSINELNKQDIKIKINISILNKYFLGSVIITPIKFIYFKSVRNKMVHSI